MIGCDGEELANHSPITERGDRCLGIAETLWRRPTPPRIYFSKTCRVSAFKVSLHLETRRRMVSFPLPFNKLFRSCLFVSCRWQQNVCSKTKSRGPPARPPLLQQPRPTRRGHDLPPWQKRPLDHPPNRPCPHTRLRDPALSLPRPARLSRALETHAPRIRLPRDLRPRFPRRAESLRRISDTQGIRVGG